MFEIMKKFFSWKIATGGSVVTVILNWIAKKFGFSSIMMALSITVSSAYVLFLTVAIVYILDFIIKLWLTFKDLIS